MSLNQKIKTLMQRLKSADCDEKIRAMKSLCRLGMIAESTTDSVLALIDHENWKIRSRAATTLGYICSNHPKVINSLLLTLQDEKCSVRNSSAWALGNICTSENLIISEILEAYHSHKISIHHLAWIAGSLEEKAKDALPELINAMEDSDFTVRHVAYDAICKINPQSSSMFKDLVWSNIMDKKPKKVIKLIEGSLSDLKNTLKSNSPSMRKRAIFTIGQSQEINAKLITYLASFLRDPSNIVRCETRELFEKLGIKTLGALIDQLSSTDIYMQEISIVLLGKCGSKAALAAPHIVKFLDSQNGILKRSALIALGEIGTPSSVYLEEIIRCLFDKRITVRRCAAAALRNLRNHISDTQKEEIKLFSEDQDSWVRDNLEFLI